MKVRLTKEQFKMLKEMLVEGFYSMQDSGALGDDVENYVHVLYEMDTIYPGDTIIVEDYK